MDSIGKRIHTLRKQHNLTMKQLHELTGLSTGNISDMEHDRYMPSVASLIPLSKALSCSIDWLLTGDSDNRESENLQSSMNFRLSEHEQDMFRMFKALSTEQQEELYELIHFKYQRYVETKKGSIFSTYTAEERGEKSTKSDDDKSSFIA